MNATDLMIGDWVQSEDLVKPARYTGIIGEYTPAGQPPYKRLRFLYEGGIEGSDVPESRVLPIPLTVEILEKNGFVYQKDYGSYYMSLWGDIASHQYVRVGWNFKGEVYQYEVATSLNRDGYTKWNKKSAFGNASITVHELQHLLRICGLNDLADNFRV